MELIEEEENATLSLDTILFKTPERIEKGFSTPTTVRLRKSKTPNKQGLSRNDRGRTPSGQQLTSDFNGLRSFFQTGKSSPSIDSYFKKRKIEESEVNMMGALKGHQSQSQSPMKEHVESVKHDSAKCANHEESDHDMQSEKAILMDVIKCKNTEQSDQSEDLHSTMDEEENINEKWEEAADSEGQTPILQAMDTIAVMKMFHEIKDGLKKVTERVNEQEKLLQMEIKDREEQAAAAATAIPVMPQKMNEELQKMKNEVDSLKRRNHLLCGQVSRMTQTIGDLQEKIEKIEINAGKRMVVLSGFYGHKKKYVCLKQLDDFFEKQMKIDVFVEDVFPMGDFNPPNLVITFQSMEDKRLLFRHIERIKKLENKDGQRLYFKDFLPAQINERNKREKDILWDNKRKPPSERIKDMAIGKNGLSANKRLYQKKVLPPDPCAMIKMPIKEIEDVLKLGVIKAKEAVKESSDSFIGYYTDANGF